MKNNLENLIDSHQSHFNWFQIVLRTRLSLHKNVNYNWFLFIFVGYQMRINSNENISCKFVRKKIAFLLCPWQIPFTFTAHICVTTVLKIYHSMARKYGKHWTLSYLLVVKISLFTGVSVYCLTLIWKKSDGKRHAL